MFDVVTDIPRTDEIEVFLGTVGDRLSVSLLPLSTGAGHDLAAPRYGDRLKEQLAQPRQLVAMGQGLAYLERVAPTGCEGMEMLAR